MIRNILVPTDGSPNADRAMRFACELAARHGAKIILVHVVPTVKTPEAIRQYVEAEHIDASPETFYTKELAEKIVEKPKEALEEAKIPHKISIETGDPAERILACAEKCADIDAIVMGTRGLGVLRFMLGSVTERVARYANCAVIIGK